MEEEQGLRRSLRRIALTEINEGTPDRGKEASPDEMVIIQRGPRCKPITWSPVDYEQDRSKLFVPSRERTPEPVRRKEINPKLRRRLVLSPTKNASEDLGYVIAKKLKYLQSYKEKEIEK